MFYQSWDREEGDGKDGVKDKDEDENGHQRHHSAIFSTIIILIIKEGTLTWHEGTPA